MRAIRPEVSMLGASLALLLLPAAAHADDEVIPIGSPQIGEVMTFELEGALGLQSLHPPDGVVPGSLAGMQFPTNWWRLTGNPLVTNNPSGTSVAVYTGSDSHDILFNAGPVSHVSLHYASVVPIVLEGLDADGGVVASAEGPANAVGAFDQWDVLAVESPGIWAVRIQAVSGNAVIDDVTVLWGGPCSGEGALLGTDGDDVLVGTAGDDVIDARAGDDLVLGLGGNDVICGGDGHDLVSAGPGNDTVYGDAGNDLLYGGAGNDVLDGGDDLDLLLGGPDTDTCPSEGDFAVCEQ